MLQNSPTKHITHLLCSASLKSHMRKITAIVIILIIKPTRYEQDQDGLITIFDVQVTMHHDKFL